MIFQELRRRADADGGREHLARPLAGAPRDRALARRAAPRGAGARAARRRPPARRARRRPVGRRAAGRRDRPRAVGRGALPDPRRADRRALRARDRAAVRLRLPGCASRASRSSTSPTASTRCARSPTGSRCCATATSCSRARRRRCRGASSSPRWSGARSPTCTAPEDVPAPDGSTPVLALAGATLDGAFEDVTLEVRAGEVLTLYGKLGSGTAEVAQCAFGIRKLSAGTMALEGRPVAFRNPADAIAAGVGLLPADRQREGAFMVRPVAENLAAPSWGRLAGRGGVDHAPARGAGVPALARRAQHPLAQRSRAAARDALGRQPAEGAARPLARARLAPARADRADARRRRGRARRRSTARSARSRAAASAC